MGQRYCQRLRGVEESSVGSKGEGLRITILGFLIPSMVQNSLIKA